MNLTRWSARLPGAQRRAHQPADTGSTSGVPATREAAADGPATRTGCAGQDAAGRAPGEQGGHEHLPVRDVLSHLPALVAVGYGPNHRVGYLSHAWTELFGHRPTGIPAHKILPELEELGLLALMDQVYRTGRPRTVKARRVTHSSNARAAGPASAGAEAAPAVPHTRPDPTAAARPHGDAHDDPAALDGPDDLGGPHGPHGTSGPADGDDPDVRRTATPHGDAPDDEPSDHGPGRSGPARYFTFVCAPVRESEELGAQLAVLAGGGATPAHGTRVLGGLGAFANLRRSTGASDVCGVLVFGAEVTDQVQVTESLRESERRHREAAVTLQRSLLPQKLEQPDDLRVAATYQPGGADAAVGGDWYDVITLGGGRTALVIGDVMGRGMRAAAVMGQLRTAVRAYARMDLPPHEVLRLLDGLAAEIDATQIATCVYTVFDPGEQQLTYASAGHLPVMIRRPDGSIARPPDDCAGPPLGTGNWLHTSTTLPFTTGSTGVLYTDGLVERRDKDIDHGLDALAATLRGATGRPEVICSRLLRAMGVGPEHDDDVAVLVFQLPEREPETSQLFRSAALDLLGGTEAASSARAFTTGVLASWRLADELQDLSILAVSELVSNSLMHGHPPTRLRLRRTDRRLTVEVTDADEHLPTQKQATPVDETGRGIAIVAAISANWGTRRTPEGGKAVWCEFDIGRRGA